jgi:MFS family permease
VTAGSATDPSSGAPAGGAGAAVPAHGAPAAGAAPETGTPRRRRIAIDLRPLRHPAYRRLFVGNSVSAFGFQFTAVAVPVQMYALTRSSLWVGLLGLAALVPLLVFALWGGALADVVDRRRLLLAGSVLMWLSTLALLAQSALAVDSPGLILALVAVQSVAFAVSTPTRAAIIPRLVDDGEVAAANTLGYTAFQVATVAGPLGAGLVLAHAGPTTAYLLDALLFTTALWAALRLPPLLPERSGAPGRSRLHDVAEGLRYLRRTPVLVLSFVIDIAAMVLAMPRALFPEVAAERYGGGGAIGWLYGAIALGSVVAGLSSGWIGRVRRQGVALVAAVAAWGVAVALAGLAPSLWSCVLLLALAGAADLVSAVYRQTMLLTYVPDELRGRMQGVFTAVVAGGPRLGDLRAGATAAAWGTTVAWTGGGVAAAVLAVALGLAFPALLRYTSPERSG